MRRSAQNVGQEASQVLSWRCDGVPRIRRVSMPVAPDSILHDGVDTHSDPAISGGVESKPSVLTAMFVHFCQPSSQRLLCVPAERRFEIQVVRHQVGPVAVLCLAEGVHLRRQCCCWLTTASRLSFMHSYETMSLAQRLLHMIVELGEKRPPARPGDEPRRARMLERLADVRTLSPQDRVERGTRRHVELLMPPKNHALFRVADGSGIS
jgi:hypothetical protein